MSNQNYIIFTAKEFFDRADPVVVAAFLEDTMPPEWKTKEDFLREYDTAPGYLEFRSWPHGFWTFHIHEPLAQPAADVYVPGDGTIAGRWYQGEASNHESLVAAGMISCLERGDFL